MKETPFQQSAHSAPATPTGASQERHAGGSTRPTAPAAASRASAANRPLPAPLAIAPSDASRLALIMP